ncbi:MAG: hypothetical protein IMY73_01530 [Bacteroidetes bacterium]|nr:hypothetical protein [Bacteroidota bacterium]
MKKIICFLLLAILVSCSKVTKEKPIIIDQGEDAVLVYIASDNNLYSYAIKNIEQIEEAYKEFDKKQIFVYYDSPDDKIAKLIRIFEKKGLSSQNVVLKTYVNPNSCSPSHLNNVIIDAMNFCKGGKTVTDIILSSHGNSWLPAKHPSLSPAKISEPLGGMNSFGEDNSHNHSQMNIDALADVLEKFKFETIIFDACYMSNMEVIYELRNSAKYIIASSAEVLADGFAYDETTKYLLEERIDVINYAKTYFNHYNIFTDAKKSATIAVVKCSEIDSFKDFVKNLIDKYALQINNSEISETVPQFDRFNNKVIYDLKFYLRTIVSNYATVGDKDKELSNIDTAFSKMFLYEAHTDMMLNILDLSKTNGISCFIPTPETPDSYKNYYLRLQWGDDSGLSNPIFFNKEDSNIKQ